MNVSAAEDFNTEDDTGVYHLTTKVAYVIPRVTAAISFVACTCTVWECIHDIRSSYTDRTIPPNDTESGSRRRQARRNSSDGASRNTAPTRALLSYQIPLMLYHFTQVLGQTPAPRDMDPPTWGARGTLQTCEAQAFVSLSAMFSGIL